MFCNEPYNYFESVKKDAIVAIYDSKESYPYFYDLLKGEGKNDEEKIGEMVLCGDFEAIDVIVRCFVLYDVINDLVDNKEADL